MKKGVWLLAGGICVAAALFVLGCQSRSAEKPLEITLYYSDNPTLPFRSDWLVVRKVEEWYKVKINWEVIPNTDYATKVSLVLNSGVNAPDVILYQNISGENASLAMNGAIVPISDYSQWTPNFNARVNEYGLQADVDRLKLKDGKRYNLPALFDAPFYDGGLILREDVLEYYGFSAPRTFDDLYAVMKAYKQDNPSSYPMTVLVAPQVHYRMSQPSWGISVHRSGSGGSRVLSWDYNRNSFFAGAVSEQYREYMRFWHKCYAEGLMDPEVYPEGDAWATKMATGSAIATYAYYDQIGGLLAAAEIPGYMLNMYPPLLGPGGAHHQQKNRTDAGILFPAATAKRKDFEQVVRAVDAMFYSPEAALLWCVGVEGETYRIENGQIRYIDSIANSPDGIYKHMQLRYGCGSASSQMVWVNAREMTKYDENYADINRRVAAMGDAIQSVPPTPKFDDLTAEQATSLMGPLYDAFVTWDDAFLTGAKSLDADWAAYVAEMEQKGINEFLALYNDNR